MRALAAGPVVMCTGLMLSRMAITGDHQKYVRPGMGPYLIVAGALLLILGLVTTVQAVRDEDRALDDDQPSHDEPGDDHGHAHRPGHVAGRLSYLLIAPLIAVVIFSPPALGSFAVERSAAVQIQPTETIDAYPSLTSTEPTEMTLFEFTNRAYDRSGASFAGKPVTLTGFVHRERDGKGFQLARYQIACCAADALSAVVRVVGAGPSPRRDSWVTVTGTFTAMDAGGTAEIAATQIRPITPPAFPYE